MPVLVVDQVLTGADLGLDWGPSDLLYADIGGRTVLYVLSRTDGALSEATVSASGLLTPVQSIAVSGSFVVGSDPALGLIGSSIALAGMSENSGQFVLIDEDGSLGAQTSQPNLGTMVAPVSFANVLISGRIDMGGLDTFVVDEVGYTWVSGLDDDATVFLADVIGTAKITMPDGDFIAAVSATENGVTLVEVSALGVLLASDSFGTLDGLPIGMPSAIEAVRQLGDTYLVVAGSGSSSLSTLRVSEGGTMWMADHVLDSADTQFQAASSLATTTVGDFAFVAAGGAGGGVSLFTMLPGGRIIHLASIMDEPSTTFYRVSALTMTAAGGALQIFAGSAWEAGLTRLSYDLSMLGSVLVGAGPAVVGSNLNDQVIGSDMADELAGGDGDDILFDGNGSDIMTGGPGADLFVFAADGLTDSILDFEAGTDRLDLSAFDFLYDLSQLTITGTTNGATLTFRDETRRYPFIPRTVERSGRAISQMETS